MSTILGLKLAKQLGVPITIHAGEWPEDKFKSSENIKFAVDELKVDRIGHGLALAGKDQDIIHLKEKKVPVEVCLTSNVGFGFKCNSFEKQFSEGRCNGDAMNIRA